MKEYNLALALGGGGVRCMAHLGVFRALHEHGIEPDLIVGSSIGSVLGGVYAYIRDPHYVDIFADKFSKNETLIRLENILRGSGGNILTKLISKTAYAASVIHACRRHGFLSEELVRKAFRNILGKGILNSHKFLLEDTAIPFAALTTDYASAEAVAVTQGELPKFLYASSAFPGICKPVLHGDRVLMDGGIISVLPVMAAHLLGAKKIIAVDTEAVVTRSHLKNSIQSINTATDIRGFRLNIVEKGLADITISPAIKNYRFFEFSKWEACRKAGYDSTIECIDSIKSIASSSESVKSYQRTSYESYYPFAVI